MPAQTEIRLAVLLVEDDDNDAFFIRQALESARLRCPIVRVGGGLEALAYLNGDPPFEDQSRYSRVGLVLLDIRMPGMDGFEVLRWIRHNPRLLGLPVVMLTGCERVQDANTAYQLGANLFLLKPFDFDNYPELSQTVQRFIAP